MIFFFWSDDLCVDEITVAVHLSAISGEKWPLSRPLNSTDI